MAALPIILNIPTKLSQWLSNYGPFCILLHLVFIAYVQTMLPSQAFHDTGEMQVIVATVNVGHTTGFPTYVLLGKALIALLPFGDIAWRVNLLSVFYTIGMLTFLGLFLLRLTRTYYALIVPLGLLAFSRDFWDNAIYANVQALHRFFLFLLIYICFRLTTRFTLKLWILFCVVYGVGLGNSLFLLYAAPGLTLWLLVSIFQRKIPRRPIYVVYGLTGFFCGLSVYLLLPLREYFGPILSIDYSLQSWSGFIRHLTGSDAHNLMFQGGIANIFDKSMNGLVHVFHAYSPWGVALGLLGLGYGFIKQRTITIVCFILFTSLLLFATNFASPSKYYVSYVAVYAIYVTYGFLGINTFLKTIAIKFFKSQIVFSILQVLVFSFGSFLVYQYYNINFSLVNKSGDLNAVVYSEDVFLTMQPNGIIMTGWNEASALWYRREVLKQRQDITIVLDDGKDWLSYVDKYIATHPVYLVNPEIAIAQKYTVKPDGPIFRVLQK